MVQLAHYVSTLSHSGIWRAGQDRQKVLRDMRGEDLMKYYQCPHGYIGYDEQFVIRCCGSCKRIIADLVIEQNKEVLLKLSRE